jgi:hypothetical protein
MSGDFKGYDAISGTVVDLAALVEHPTKDSVVIKAAPGYTLTLFQIAGADLEVMVTSDKGDDSWRIKLENRTGQRKAIKQDGNVIEVIYG